MLRNAVGVGVEGVSFPRKKRYEGVRVKVTRGWVGVKFPGKSVRKHLKLNGPYS